MKRLLFLGATALWLLSGRSACGQYVFTNIVDSTMAAPVGLFAGFSDPAISGNSVAFRGNYASSVGEGGVGIFVGGGGPLTTVAKFGDPVLNGRFRSDFGDPTISGTSVAFRASHSTGFGVFVGSGGPLTIIAKSGDPAPVGSLERFGTVAISGSTVAFTGAYLNAGRSALFTGSGGPLTTIHKAGDPGPSGEVGGAVLPSISGNNVAFLAEFGASHNPVVALFKKSDAGLIEIAKPGDAVAEGILSSVGLFSIADSAVAFGASYAGGSGIFFDNIAGIITIAKLGDTAPIGTFSSIGSPSTNGSEVAFIGIYEGLSQGAIFIGDGGPLKTLIKSGDELFGSTVIRLDFGRFGFDPTGSGNFAFGYGLADGRSGIAMGRLVPEPSGGAITFFAMAAVGVTGLRCGRRKLSHSAI
jgi:hypothetical protein